MALEKPGTMFQLFAASSSQSLTDKMEQFKKNPTPELAAQIDKLGTTILNMKAMIGGDPKDIAATAARVVKDSTNTDNPIDMDTAVELVTQAHRAVKNTIETPEGKFTNIDELRTWQKNFLGLPAQPYTAATNEARIRETPAPKKSRFKILKVE